MAGDDLLIRESRDADINSIAAIYAHHVLYGVASFEEVPPSVDEMARRRADLLARGFPYFVAERSGRVAGYCYAGQYRPRIGYRFSLEDSIYIDAGEVGRGVGRTLLGRLLERSTELGYRQMVAVIGGTETVASIRLHQALGFTHVGVLSGIGFKFGRWIDSVLMQRGLGPGNVAPPD
jgi:phosphinothricin acetyltransferase